MVRYKKWILAPPVSTVVKYFKPSHKHTKYLPEYESDVTSNPFRSPIRGRIRKLRKPEPHYPKGSHRWSKSDLRIVYLPIKESHTISTLDVNTAPHISYKKR